MKKVSIFLAFILITVIKAQAVSDYKYISLPSELNDFKENRSFGLNLMLEKTLKAKKYVVLPETKSNWPADALGNPCKVLSADILDDKNMFRNKIILQFKNCNNQIVLTQKGLSTIKEFEPGYQDALKQALVQIPVSNPSSQIENLAEAKSQEVVKTSEEPKPKEVIPQTSSAQKYSNQNKTFQKIQIADDQFILVDGNSSVPFATFKSTAKKDVYRVKLGSGESTIGYYENGNIVIEMPIGNGEFANEIFTAN